MIRALLVFLLFLAQTTGFSQIRGTLELEKLIPIHGLPQNGLMLPIRCDAESNIYFREQVGDYAVPGSIQKVSRDGKRVAIFSLRGIPELEKVFARPFAVGVNGEVFQLVLSKQGSHLVIYDGDGTYRRKVKLPSTWDAYGIQGFRDGNFLVSGSLRRKEQGSEEEPFAAIMRFDGMVLRTITPKEIKADRSPADNSGAAFADWKLADWTLGEDGNAYLMKVGTAPILWAISPAGKIVRTLQLSVPLPGSKAISMRMNRGTVSVQFQSQELGPDRRHFIIFSTYDSSTGDRIAEYRPALEVGGAFACFNTEEFSFIAGDGQNMAVIRAAAR